MSYDNWLDSKPDGCECLSELQVALLKIPAFCLEAEDNAEVSQRHALHLYATTGDKSAYLGLLEDIVDDYAELCWTDKLNDNYRCCEACDAILANWQEIQREDERAAA